MKKIKKAIVVTITMMFALTIGAAYADEGGNILYNGVTDFSGRSYDSLSAIGPAASGEMSVESSEAGGMRSEETGIELNLSNGITDFSGRSYDTLSDLIPVPSSMGEESVESSHAGGPREEEPGAAPFNGITSFSGRSYDTLSDFDR